jgi:hypothetical protein
VALFSELAFITGAIITKQSLERKEKTMNAYSIALFLHIAGVMGISVALGLEWTGLWQIQHAVLPDQVRGWMGILKDVRRVGFASMLTAVLTGIYMMLTVWGGVAWAIVSLGALVLVIALSQVLTAPRMTAIGRALMTASVPQIFQTLASQPLLWVSIQTRIAITLGIVLLKTAKPDWSGSLLTIGVAIVLGIASALPASRHEQAPAGSAH